MIIGNASIYANLVAIMLVLGLIALASKLKMNDRLEKRFFLVLLVVVLLMAFVYLLDEYRNQGVIPLGRVGAVLLDMLMELLITVFAFDWFLYVDYRIFRSPEHIKRDLKVFIVPLAMIFVLCVINIFTGFLTWYDADMVYHESPLYILLDLIRLAYFIGSLIYLEIFKRKDRRLRFFSIRSFIVPTLFYILLYYFLPYATPALGLAIALALIYVQIVNNLCYRDPETGFYNRLYLRDIRSQIEKGKYELNSALLYSLPEGDTKKMAKLITAQLPEECETIRFKEHTVVTLAKADDRMPLQMLAEDVELCFEEEGIPVSLTYDLRKRNESEIAFLNRFLEKE